MHPFTHYPLCLSHYNGRTERLWQRLAHKAKTTYRKCLWTLDFNFQSRLPLFCEIPLAFLGWAFTPPYAAPTKHPPSALPPNGLYLSLAQSRSCVRTETLSTLGPQLCSAQG